MDLDLNKLIGQYRFKWAGSSLGNILVHNFTVSANSTLYKEFKNYLNTDSNEFVRILITTVCQIDLTDTSEYNDDRITYKQSELLSNSELNHFAKEFIEHNSYLKKYQSKINNAKKPDNESYSDLLKKLMHYHRLYEDEKIKELFDSLKPKNIFSSPTLRLIDKNLKLSESLGNSIGRYEAIQPIELPNIPENPVHETNRQLRALGEELSETSSLLKNMNDLGLRMAVEMASSSKITERHNTAMIVIGLVTLIFSAAMSYLTYESSNESSLITQQLLKGSNTMRMDIAKEQKEANKEIYNQLKNISHSLGLVNVAQENSDKRFEQLNSISLHTSLKYAF